MWREKKREGREEGIDSISEGKQKETNKQNYLKTCGSMLCALVNKHSGDPFFISRTISGGAARHAVLSQVAMVRTKRGTSTLTSQ